METLQRLKDRFTKRRDSSHSSQFKLIKYRSHPSQSITSQSTTRQTEDEEGEDDEVYIGKWWLPDKLLDRSLVAMAAGMSFFALLLLGVVLANVPNLWASLKKYKYTTAVTGAQGEPCRTLEIKSTVLHVFINIFATIILGMSNTYQQLATALSIEDIKYALHNSKKVVTVGKNSPFAIKWKRNGKLKAALSWIFLISTSLPVHLLANGVIGPSFYLNTKSRNTVKFITPFNISSDFSGSYYWNDEAADCWLTMTTGYYSNSADICSGKDGGRRVMEGNPFLSAQNMDVHVLENCTYMQEKYKGNIQTAIDMVRNVTCKNADLSTLECADTIFCTVYNNNLHRSNLNGSEKEPQCRITIRMSAAIILTGCILAKAIYMLAYNFRAKSKAKRKSACLSYGDVVVLCVLHPELQLKNECMVDANAIHRRRVQHKCHRHCKSREIDPTGDSVGHCQKKSCKGFNKINYASGLLHPAVAEKRKHSLLHTLGGVSTTQMIILYLASSAMLVGTVFAGFTSGLVRYRWELSNHKCGNENYDCMDEKYQSSMYTDFGGINALSPVAQLEPDSLGSEILAFIISNGAQLLFSVLYLMFNYNITLISIEREWSRLEKSHQKLRITLTKDQKGFRQSYFLQLPPKVIIPLMLGSSLMHWLLGQTIIAREYIDAGLLEHPHVMYEVVFAPIPLWIASGLMFIMTGTCWWTYSYAREGFIPTMYGSVRTICAATVGLEQIRKRGLMWGDLGEGKKFRHAGLTSEEVDKVRPSELYA